jgi:hypothetical protein
MKGGCSLKISRQAIMSVLLLFSASIIGFTTPTGFSLGDKLFLAIGIPPWSNGQTGFHYSILITFVLLLIGFMEARRAFTGRQLLLLFLLLSLLTPPSVSLLKPAYFKMHHGLAAIEYNPQQSHFDLRTSADKQNMEISGTVALTNYGRNSIEFGIKIPANNLIFQERFSQDLTLTGTEDLKEPEVFLLHPGETRTFSSYTTIPVNSFNGQGSMSGPNLILFTADDVRTVGHNL